MRDSPTHRALNPDERGAHPHRHYARNTISVVSNYVYVWRLKSPLVTVKHACTNIGGHAIADAATQHLAVQVEATSTRPIARDVQHAHRHRARASRGALALRCSTCAAADCVTRGVALHPDSNRARIRRERSARTRPACFDSLTLSAAQRADLSKTKPEPRPGYPRPRFDSAADSPAGVYRKAFRSYPAVRRLGDTPSPARLGCSAPVGEAQSYSTVST